MRYFWAMTFRPLATLLLLAFALAGRGESSFEFSLQRWLPVGSIRFSKSRIKRNGLEVGRKRFYPDTEPGTIRFIWRIVVGTGPLE